MIWSEMTRDERIQAIEDGVGEGLSVRQIAARIKGITGSGISGLARRANIRLANPPRTSKKQKASTPKPKAARPSKEEQRERKPPQRRPNREPDIEPLTTMGELEPGQCNWIRAEDQTDGLNTLMCGRDRGESKWCSYHIKRGTRPYNG